MINRLYKSNNEENDFSENEDELKTIINSLNTMNKEDIRKTMGVLKEKADDDSKKKKFFKFANKLKAIIKAKRIFKTIINKKKKEEERFDQLAGDVLDELESQDTIYLNESDNEEEEGKKNKATNLIKNMGEDEQKIVYEKLKDNAKNSVQRDKINKLFKSMKYVNKMKQLKNKALQRLSQSDIFSDADLMNISQRSDSSERLDKEELKNIVKGFENDLYEEQEKPMSRKEARENEKKNKEKIKEISKVIDSLSTKDKNDIINKLKLRADNDFKKSQFERLSKLVKNINNVRTFLEKLRQKKEINNSKNEKEKKELSQSELNNFLNKVKKFFGGKDNEEKEEEKNIDDLLENKEEKKLEETAELINNLSPNQQKEVLNKLQSEESIDIDQDKLKKLIKKIIELNKIKKLAKSININRTNKLLLNKEDNNKINEEKIELNEKEMMNLVDAILRNLFYKIKEKDKEDFLKETDKYISNNEKEKSLDRAVDILNKLKYEIKDKISSILESILKNKEQINYLKKLNKKIGLKEKQSDNITDRNIIEGYRNDDNIDELEDDKLAEITEKIMSDLMKDYATQDNSKKTDKLNRAANTIIILNNKDQEKVLDTLRHLAKNEQQKKIIQKLDKLVENLNYIQFYLYSVNQKHISKMNKKDSEINDSPLKAPKKSAMTPILDEEDEIDYEDQYNINKSERRKSVLNSIKQNKILNDLIQKTNEFEDNRYMRNSINKLNNTLKSIELAKKFSSILKIKSNNPNLKKSLRDFDIKKIAHNINNTLLMKKSPSNFTEQLLIDKHKEGKINQLAKSINVNFDEESKKKTIQFLTQNAVDDNHKKNINKLKETIIKNSSSNLSNIFNSQFYMISSLGGQELNDPELNLLIDTFCKDLFNDNIQDPEQKEDNLNLLANVIKELHEENQNKVMEKLEKKPEAKDKQDLINDLRDRILRLKLMKDELNDTKLMDSKLDHNKTINFDGNEDDDDLLDNEDNDETMVVEISMNDIGQEDLKDICDVFLLELEDNKNDEKEKNKDKDKDKEKKKDQEIEKEKEKEKEERKDQEIKKQNDQEKEEDTYYQKEKGRELKKNRHKSVIYLASSLIKMNHKIQKKITDKLEETARNEQEKKQLKELMDKVHDLTFIKKCQKELSQRNEEKNQNFKKEIERIETLSDKTEKNIEKDKLNELADELINLLYSETNVEFNKNNDIKDYLIDAENNEKIRNVALKLNCLVELDKAMILDKIEKLADNEEKKRRYNKLCDEINILEKEKELDDIIKDKEKQIVSADFIKSKTISQELEEESLGIVVQNMAKTLFELNRENSQDNEIVNTIANTVKDLKPNNQNFIINNLKEKADNEEKKDSVKKLAKLIDKLGRLKKLVNLVRKKHINKMVLEKIQDENKYGIVVLPNEKRDDKSKTVIMNKPKELEENELSHMLSIFIEDLKKMKEENENENTLSSIDKYLKEKECEKKMEEIAEVMNSLDDGDKLRISCELKKNFDNGKSNNIYDKLMKIISKKERQFDNEKRNKLRETIRAMEIDNSNILYESLKEDSNRMGTERTVTDSDKNEWTCKKGTLETEEIY